jgi:hypothetical protein
MPPGDGSRGLPGGSQCLVMAGARVLPRDRPAFEVIVWSLAITPAAACGPGSCSAGPAADLNRPARTFSTHPPE